jgi:sRNA-binding regulator protein Hfq
MVRKNVKTKRIDLSIFFTNGVLVFARGILRALS